MSISYLLPIFHLLKTKTLAADDEDTELIPTTQTLLNIATFIDPRLKKDYICKEKLPEISSRVISEMKAIQKVRIF